MTNFSTVSKLKSSKFASIRLSSALEREEKAAAQITAEMMSDEALEAIVQRVVRKMSTDVVSEIAWEIVPELSEVIIRRSLEKKSEDESS